MNEELFKSVIETVEKRLGCIRQRSVLMTAIIQAVAAIQVGNAIVEALHQVAQAVDGV